MWWGFLKIQFVVKLSLKFTNFWPVSANTCMWVVPLASVGMWMTIVTCLNVCRIACLVLYYDKLPFMLIQTNKMRLPPWANLMGGINVLFPLLLFLTVVCLTKCSCPHTPVFASCWSYCKVTCLFFKSCFCDKVMLVMSQIQYCHFLVVSGWEKDGGVGKIISDTSVSGKKIKSIFLICKGGWPKWSNTGA